MSKSPRAPRRALLSETERAAEPVKRARDKPLVERMAKSITPTVGALIRSEGDDRTIILFDAKAVEDAAARFPAKMLPRAIASAVLGMFNFKPGCAVAGRATYAVEGTVARSGWGPALYDAALTVAALDRRSVIPDRSSVTPAAEGVWRFYAERRADDVTTTPIGSDDCDLHGSDHPWLDRAYRATHPLVDVSALVRRGSDAVRAAAAATKMRATQITEWIADAAEDFFSTEYRKYVRASRGLKTGGMLEAMEDSSFHGSGEIVVSDDEVEALMREPAEARRERAREREVEFREAREAEARERAAQPVITWAGWPWPAGTVAYHASTAAATILCTGFKTRRQGAASAAGGGHRDSVSFTLAHQRAAAIALGLDTMARAAKGLITLRELADGLAAECPVAFPGGMRNTDVGGKLDDAMIDWFDQGYTYARWWADGAWQDGWYAPGELMPPKVRNQAYNRLDAIFELYRKVLQAGKHARECFDPHFTGTSMGALAALDRCNIGVLSATIDVPRVCADFEEAARLGYIAAKENYGYDSSPVHGCENDLYDATQGEARPVDRRNKQSYAPRVDGWQVDYMQGERVPSETVVYSGHEEELRVYDTSKITVLGLETMPALRKRYGLGQRLTFPWFDSREVDVGIVDYARKRAPR